MPQVTSVGPQSQPKLHGSLRIQLRPWTFLLTFGDLGKDRIEGHFNVVAAGLEGAFHIELPRPVHVVGPAHLAAVHPHRGQGVEPVAAQQHALAAQHGRRHLEIAAINPAGRANPLHGCLLVAVERVGDPAGSEQVGVDAARHPGWNRGGVTRLGHAPGAVETEAMHGGMSPLMGPFDAQIPRIIVTGGRNSTAIWKPRRPLTQPHGGAGGPRPTCPSVIG
jgi:hypothetical protein